MISNDLRIGTDRFNNDSNGWVIYTGLFLIKARWRRRVMRTWAKFGAIISFLRAAWRRRDQEAWDGDSVLLKTRGIQVGESGGVGVKSKGKAPHLGVN